MFRHAVNGTILAGFALATRIELLPLLAGVYVLTSGSQWFAARRRIAELADENRHLRMAGVGPSTIDPDRPNHRRSQWWLPVELAAIVWARLVMQPLWRRVDALDDRASRGRHAIHRWDTGRIHGTIAQRRPSAAAGQRVIAASWQANTADHPVVTDTEIHTWLARGATGAIADH